MILRPLTSPRPPTLRLFTLRPGLSSLYIPPTPRLVRSLPGDLAEIHGAASPNVDSKRKNVRSKVTLKMGGGVLWARRERWGGGDTQTHSAALRSPNKRPR